MYPSALLNKSLVSLALTTLIGLATGAPLGGPLGVNLNLGALGAVKVGPLGRDTGKPNTLEKSSPLLLDLKPLLNLEADIGNLKRSNPTLEKSSPLDLNLEPLADVHLNLGNLKRSSNPTLEKSSLLDAQVKAALAHLLSVQADVGVLKRSNPTLEKSSLLDADVKAAVARVLGLTVDVGVLERSEPTN